MVYKAYELRIRLNNLILDSDINNKLEWIGTDQEHQLVEEAINKYESYE